MRLRNKQANVFFFFEIFGRQIQPEHGKGKNQTENQATAAKTKGREIKRETNRKQRTFISEAGTDTAAGFGAEHEATGVAVGRVRAAPEASFDL